VVETLNSRGQKRKTPGQPLTGASSLSSYEDPNAFRALLALLLLICHAL
jgi:hypothetical protein